jgi:tetratricopeptide (TPR) repeat protein
MGECIQYGDEAGFAIAQIYLRADLASVFGELREMDRAKRLIREAIALAEEGNAHLLPYIYAHSAPLSIDQGDLTTAEEILAAMRANDVPINVVQPQMLTLADCLLPLAKGDCEGAVQRCQSRLTDLRNYGLRGYVPETLLVGGQALAALGRTDEAEDAFREALVCAQEMRARWIEWQILAVWADLHPKVESREVKRARARVLVEEIAGDLDEPQLARSFMDREDVRQVLADAVA